jgi:hypothetical protein
LVFEKELDSLDPPGKIEGEYEQQPSVQAEL